MRRLRPITTTVDLSELRGSVEVRSRVSRPERDLFVVDIYSHLQESHPQTHPGYWVFPMPAARTFTVHLDLRAIGPDSVWIETKEGRIAPADSWTNPAYDWDPVVGIQLVRRRRSDNSVVESHVVTGKVATPAILKHFYQHVHADHGYTPAVHEPFLWKLHERVLQKLEAVFLARIPPNALVLDAGCGRSLFTEIRPKWPFRIVAADVDEGAIRSRRAEFPQLHWAVSFADPLPFRAGVFDALFAGELIEHLTNPATAMAEFRRVLKPGGVLILTTPNRRRLANIADGSDRPISPDHLSELSYDELGELMRREGFKVLSRGGLHLELLINWTSSQPKLDRLQRAWNRKWAIPLMKAMFRAGELLPRYSLDLLFVARAE